MVYCYWHLQFAYKISMSAFIYFEAKLVVNIDGFSQLWCTYQFYATSFREMFPLDCEYRARAFFLRLIFTRNFNINSLRGVLMYFASEVMILTNLHTKTVFTNIRNTACERACFLESPLI